MKLLVIGLDYAALPLVFDQWRVELPTRSRGQAIVQTPITWRTV